MELTVDIIRKQADCRIIVMKLGGRLDANTVSCLNERMDSLSTDFDELHFDMSKLDYLSSAGLRTVLATHKWADKENIKFKVVNPNDDVSDVFEMTGFNRFVDIIHTEEDSEDGTMSDSMEDFYPLRPIQRWMLDTHLQKAKSTMMNAGGLARLDDSIDMERLADALNGTLAAHDIFRCRLLFHPETGDLCQRFDGSLSKVRLETMSEEEFQRRKQELKKPYQIIDRPLFRIYLMITPSGKYLYTDFYHVIMDGVAVSMLFFREVDLRYRGKPIKQEAYSYAEYVRQEADKAKDEVGIAYWRTMLKDFAEEKHLPPIDKSDGNWKFDAHLATLQNIRRDFFRESGYAEQTFLMAGVMLAMAKSAGSRETIMSYVHNGRANRMEMRLMGLMLIQIPVRYDYNRDMTVDEYIHDLDAKLTEGFQYRDSLGTVYSEGLEDDCASFILQKGNIMGNASGEVPICGTKAVIQELPQNKASAVENSLDIHVIIEDDDSYRLKLEYDASRYSEEAMGRFAQLVDDMMKGLQQKDKSVLELLA